MLTVCGKILNLGDMQFGHNFLCVIIFLYLFFIYLFNIILSYFFGLFTVYMTYPNNFQ